MLLKTLHLFLHHRDIENEPDQAEQIDPEENAPFVLFGEREEQEQLEDPDDHDHDREDVEGDVGVLVEEHVAEGLAEDRDVNRNVEDDPERVGVENVSRKP